MGQSHLAVHADFRVRLDDLRQRNRRVVPRRRAVVPEAPARRDARRPSLKHGSPTHIYLPLRTYRCASRLKEAAVVRMPSAYGVPAKPNSLANLLESKRYGPSLWYSIS